MRVCKKEPDEKKPSPPSFGSLECGEVFSLILKSYHITIAYMKVRDGDKYFAVNLKHGTVMSMSPGSTVYPVDACLQLEE